MTVGVVVAAVILVVVGGAVYGVRVPRARSTKLSVKTYEHALEVLGDVANRSEIKAHVNVLPESEVGQPHVHTEVGDTSEPASPHPIALPPRIELPGVLARSSQALPVFGEDEVPGAVPRPRAADQRQAPSIDTAPGPAAALISQHRETAVFPTPPTPVAPKPAIVFDDAPTVESPPELQQLELLPEEDEPSPVGSRLAPLLSGERTRLVAIGAAIVIAVLIGGGIYFSLGTTPTHPVAAPATTTAPAPVHVKKKHHTTTVTPSLSPTQVTTLADIYVEPKGSYSLTITADGPMWLGFERAANAKGPWLATPTIGTGDINTYDFSTSGPLVILVGAPDKLTSVTVNGKTLVVPPGRVVPFDITFVPAPAD